ncbi:hypothetical protein Pint_06709 [Pistacia integerrima]|uniref:Uncharacterized protein n=1 Tax=Pistacia integerrima TaxID=434235 RepID=A0ACC0Z7U1_9ROSI|nr:hypothetical protein Pint_06709 [Pistacia integerrima]
MAFMSNGECRRSARLSELDARKAQQAKSQNGANGTSQLGMVQDSGPKKDSCQKLGRKRKTRPVHDLVDTNVNCQVQKAGTSNDEDYRINAADVLSRIATPERKNLELLLSKLKRRDFYRIFAEPVDPIEVEGYYDVIKEPMDFSTITEKLNRGSYVTVQEFEHDISLVYNNAMHFNASDTIYYKQAHAIKQLANKLFSALKADPTNFETECSMRNVRPRRRVKAVSGSLNSNSCNNTNGRRYERGSRNFELQPRWTYSSRTSFLKENEPLVTQVYNSTKNLELDKEKKIGYSESLIQFANNLGPTAQMVAKRILERGMAGSSNYHLRASNDQNSAVVSACMELSTGPPLKLLGNTIGFHRFSGEEVDIQNGILNGGKALSVDSMDIYDVLRGGIAQASSTMKTLGEIHKRRVQAPDNQFTAAEFARKGISVAPSLKVDGNSVRYLSLSGKELDIHGGTLSGNGFNKHVSVTGDGKLDFPAEWETNSNPNKFSFVRLMLEAIHDSFEQTTDVVSSGLEMQELLPTSYSCPSSSLLWPFQSMPGGPSRSQDIGFIQEVDLQNLGGVCQIQAREGREGPSLGGNMEQESQVLNWFKLKVDRGSSSTQALGSMQGLDSHYLGVRQVQATADEAGPSHGGNVLQGGEVSNWYKLTGFGVDGAGPSHGGIVNGRQVSNWFKPTELGPEPIPDDWFQQQCRSLAEVELLCQAEPLQQQGWDMTPYDGKTMETSNMCDRNTQSRRVENWRSS